MSSVPLPALDQENAAFWTAGQRGELLIHRCAHCRAWLHPPAPICRVCLSTAVSPERVSGRGDVLTYTVNRQQWVRDMPVPFVLAVVVLDEDPRLRLTSRLVDVEPEDVGVGLRVEVVFEQVEDVWLPLFRPAGDIA
jgi:uncharacterized OB-fold protein